MFDDKILDVMNEKSRKILFLVVKVVELLELVFNFIDGQPPLNVETGRSRVVAAFVGAVL